MSVESFKEGWRRGRGRWRGCSSGFLPFYSLGARMLACASEAWSSICHLSRCLEDWLNIGLLRILLILPSTLPQEFWDIRHTATMFVFYLVSEDSNVGSHTCGESTLPAEISLCLSTVWSWYLICIRHCCLWAKDDPKDNTYVDRVSGLNPW